MAKTKKNKKPQLKVIYDGELNLELDKAIKLAVKPFGFEWWASGYIGICNNGKSRQYRQKKSRRRRLIYNKRDLAFEKLD